MKKYVMSSIFQKVSDSPKFKAQVARWKRDDPQWWKFLEGMDRFFQSKDGQRLLKRIVRKVIKNVKARAAKKASPDRKHRK
jgi:hypothetical protein